MTVEAETAPPPPDEIDARQAQLPPIARIATVTLALVVTGGIYMAAQIGHPVTLLPAVILAIAAGVVLLIDLVLLTRIKMFAWNTFFQVFGWALVAYLVIAGILEYVFIFDHTPARQMILFSIMLAMFAIDVPLLLGFSVARYQPVPT
jgi:hypothetical protein